MKILIAISILLLCPAALFEQAIVVKHKAAAGLPTYSTNLSGCSWGSGAAACTMTVAVGDFVHMWCATGEGYGSTSFTASSTPSATWNTDPAGFLNAGYGNYGEGFWAIMASSGSTLFSCPGTTTEYHEMIQIYKYTGGSGTRSVEAHSENAATSPTTGPFTTTAPTITIVCIEGANGPWLVGTVGGNTGTHFAQSTGGYDNTACFDYSTTSSLSGAYSVMGGGTTYLIHSVSFK